MLRPKEIPPSDTSHHPLTGTFICVGLEKTMKVYPATEIVSSLPRSDVILISCALPKGTLQSLPLSPYPAQLGTPIRAHFVAQSRQLDEGWTPWIGDTWGKWARGNVLGYRDFAGQEAKVSCIYAPRCVFDTEATSLERMMLCRICYSLLSQLRAQVVVRLWTRRPGLS